MKIITYDENQFIVSDNTEMFTYEHSSGMTCNPFGKEYCMPTAIGALIGVPAAKVADAVLKIRKDKDYNKKYNRRVGTKKVKSANIMEIEWILDYFGWDIVDDGNLLEGLLPDEWGKLDLRQLPPLSRIVRDLKSDKKGKYLIQVKGHLVAYHNGYIMDTLKREGIEATRYPKGKRRVVRWWKIQPKG